ncbi:hypothetical protein EAI_10367 [Harpegnathos saltator]|uniref:Uncharacterized protein n=1 Tax=Harpegnathos saltator TaxID=610380 RepID=E2B5Q8_HARSA|nr:hypothetical protein EAI_10367 [Harpegnathos saltator]
MKECPKLEECPTCRTIAYCSEEHRLLHLPQHKEICDAIIEVNKQRNMHNFCGNALEEWTNFKKENMQAVEQQLHRELELYEQQMLLFPKSCFICHKHDNLKIFCSYCVCVNICCEHNLVFREHNCRNMQHCLVLDYTQALKDRDGKFVKNDVYINLKEVNDMLSFMEQYLQHKITPDSLDNVHFECTEYFSRPLTLIYGLREGNLLHLQSFKTIIIHIISGTFEDINSLYAWELLLHECNEDVNVLIIMIGPDLQEKCRTLELCETCKAHNKKLQFEYRRTLYHNYVVSRFHMQPHVIIGFNARFMNDIELSTTMIRTVRSQSCVFLLTTECESKVQQNMIMIREIVYSPMLTPVFSGQNRFRSWRPYRDYENDGLFYSNKYLIIYMNLVSIRTSVSVRYYELGS